MVDAATPLRDASTGPAAPSRDLFRQTGLPEISGSKLTVDHVASGLLHHGALVVRGLFPAGRLQELRRFLDLGAMRIMPGSQGNVDQARMLDALVETHEDTGTLALAESYVGDRPVGMLQRTLVKRNARTRGLNWHQDGAFFLGRCGALSVWTALTPCGESCPGLSVIPRRFETVFDPDHQAKDLSRRTISVAEELARETGVASPTLEPGDAILFDEMTLHRTSARRWSVPFRDVAITWFFAPSRFPVVFEPLAF
jgi:hypothetical protein